jgi:hemoglobin
LWYNGHIQMGALLGLQPNYTFDISGKYLSVGLTIGGTNLSNFTSLYEAIGGAPVIRDIVSRFYPKVQAHPLLGPLFPEDINPTVEKQYLFLSQFLGGPSLYSDANGHPMMRARHLPFPITPERAEAWLGCMAEALAETSIPEPFQKLLIERLSGTAHHFVNTEPS